MKTTPKKSEAKPAPAKTPAPAAKTAAVSAGDSLRSLLRDSYAHKVLGQRDA